MSSSATPWFVAIGASGAEGLSDIKELLASLPVPIPAVVLVVLHRPWDKPSHLREVLSRDCGHPILIAEEGEKFAQGTIYIGEPSQHHVDSK
jgi:two-component system, chemotaxis family, protein-glutamate methylesterase/glutaminase